MSCVIWSWLTDLIMFINNHGPWMEARQLPVLTATLGGLGPGTLLICKAEREREGSVRTKLTHVSKPAYSISHRSVLRAEAVSICSTCVWCTWVYGGTWVYGAYHHKRAIPLLGLFCILLPVSVFGRVAGFTPHLWFIPFAHSRNKMVARLGFRVG